MNTGPADVAERSPASASLIAADDEARRQQSRCEGEPLDLLALDAAGAAEADDDAAARRARATAKDGPEVESVSSASPAAPPSAHRVVDPAALADRRGRSRTAVPSAASATSAEPAHSAGRQCGDGSARPGTGAAADADEPEPDEEQRLVEPPRSPTARAEPARIVRGGEAVAEDRLGDAELDARAGSTPIGFSGRARATAARRRTRSTPERGRDQRVRGPRRCGAASSARRSR